MDEQEDEDANSGARQVAHALRQRHGELEERSDEDANIVLSCGDDMRVVDKFHMRVA